MSMASAVASSVVETRATLFAGVEAGVLATTVFDGLVVAIVNARRRVTGPSLLALCLAISAGQFCTESLQNEEKKIATGVIWRVNAVVELAASIRLRFTGKK
jgi:hypothetical protein